MSSPLMARRPSRRPSPLRPVETFASPRSAEREILSGGSQASLGVHPAVQTFPGVRQGSVGSVKGQELAEELRELSTLHHEGELSPGEFTAAKRAVIGLGESLSPKLPPTTSSSPVRKPFVVPVPSEVEMLAEENRALKQSNEELRQHLSRKPNLGRLMEELQGERDATENLREMLKKSKEKETHVSSVPRGLLIESEADKAKIEELESQLRSERATLDMLTSIQRNASQDAEEMHRKLSEELTEARLELREQQALKGSDAEASKASARHLEGELAAKDAVISTLQAQVASHKRQTDNTQKQPTRDASPDPVLVARVEELEEELRRREDTAAEEGKAPEGKVPKEQPEQLEQKRDPGGGRTDVLLIEKENDILIRERDKAQSEKNQLALKVKRLEKQGLKDTAEDEEELVAARKEILRLKDQLLTERRKHDVMSNSNASIGSDDNKVALLMDEIGELRLENNRLMQPDADGQGLADENAALKKKNVELQRRMKTDLETFRQDLEEVKKGPMSDVSSNGDRDTLRDELKELRLQVLDSEDQIANYNKTRRKIAVVLSATADWRLANSRYKALLLYCQAKRGSTEENSVPSPRKAHLGITAEETTSRGGTDGVRVAAVHSGGKAAKAGLQPGDVIIEIDSQVISTSGDLVDAAANIDPSKNVAITYVRDNAVYDTTLRDAAHGDGTLDGGGLSYDEVVRNLMASERRRSELELLVREVGDIDAKLTLAGVAAQVKMTHEVYMGVQGVSGVKVAELTVVMPNNKYHKILYVAESESEMCEGDVLLKANNEFLHSVHDLAECSSGGKTSFTICRPSTKMTDPPLLLTMELSFGTEPQQSGYTSADDATPPPTAPPPVTHAPRASIERAAQPYHSSEDHDVAWL